MAFDLKESWPLVVAGLGVVGGLYFLSQNSAGTSGYSFVPAATDPSTPTAADTTALAEANLQASSAYENDIFGAFGELTQFGQQESANTIQADEALALAQSRNTATQIQANSALNIATLNANTQTSIASANAHAQQQTSLWNDIFGGVESVLPFSNLGSLFSGSATSNTLPGIGSGLGPGVVGPNTATATYI